MYLEAKLLKQFYKEILVWVDKGTPENSVFKSDAGLCENLKMWFTVTGHDEHKWSTVELQHWIFQQKYNSPFYPFGSKEEFIEDIKQKSIYTNPVRIAFLRSQVPVIS